MWSFEETKKSHLIVLEKSLDVHQVNIKTLDILYPCKLILE